MHKYFHLQIMQNSIGWVDFQVFNLFKCLECLPYYSETSVFKATRISKFKSKENSIYNPIPTQTHFLEKLHN